MKAITAGTVLVGLVAVIIISVVIYFSWAPPPLLLAEELNGEWILDRGGGRKSQKNQQQLIHFQFAVNKTNLFTDDMSLSEALTIQDVTIPAGMLNMDRLRIGSSAWVWSGTCLPDAVCTMHYHRSHILFAIFSSSAEPRTYTLIREQVGDDNLWERKGKYVTIIFVVVAVAKALSDKLNPSKKRRLLDAKMKRFMK